MFIGRDSELSELNRLYKGDKFQFIVIYGRRRIGKTALIDEFCKNKLHIFYTAQETNAKENLENLSEAFFSLSDFSGASFDDYKLALKNIFELSIKKRIILVIDEYPYLAQSYKGISSLFQMFVDKYKEKSKLFVILCGSSLSFMEEQVLGYQSPLFGRRTAQFKILPFNFKQTMLWFKDSNYSVQDKVLAYGITGGIPLYLSLIDQNISIKDNIKSIFLTTTGYLFEEAMNLVKQECREPAQYNSIIKAIANGATRLSEIANKTGILDTAICLGYINKMISIGIIEKKYPYKQEASKRAIYKLSDTYFQFWYKFIPNVMALVTRADSELAYEKIEPNFSDYIGKIWEKISEEYLWELNLSNKLPFVFTESGNWWGNDPVKKEQVEIDIIADDGENAIFCESKWRNEPTEAGVLEKLMEKSHLFNYKSKIYVLFSKTGFKEGLIKRAKNDDSIFLITLNDML